MAGLMSCSEQGVELGLGLRTSEMLSFHSFLLQGEHGSHSNILQSDSSQAGDNRTKMGPISPSGLGPVNGVQTFPIYLKLFACVTVGLLSSE